jgi:ubiquitin-conjugating enzyme E2 variant
MNDIDETAPAPTAVWTVPRQPTALAIFKSTGVVVSGLLLASLFVRIGITVAAGTFAWLVLPALLLGYLCADLLSGTAHWFCDTFFEENTPVIGKIVIQPFRDHHVHPQRITRYRFIEQDTTNFFLMLAPLALAFWLQAPRPESAGTLFWCCALAGLSTGSFGTNLFHKWAHARKPSIAVRSLQRIGLILGPRRHQHHHGDYSRGFCVTSGWMNPLLDAIRFFPRVELIVRFFQR